jgi:CubicO group peptidase (beta-lactamase class C family)
MLIALATGLIIASADPSNPVRRLDGSIVTPAAVDAAVARAMQSAKVTGAGIAIFNGRTIVYLKAYGVRDQAQNLALTPDSVMPAASLTKSAFATMTMQLVGEHVLDLDTPVYRYLAEPLASYERYRDLAGDPRANLITLRMLLSHTSGFPNLRFFTPEKKLSINFTPGSRYAYSGEGILLAQFVVESVTKKPVNELMRERLFDPIGMTSTSMVWEPRFERDFANGYDERGAALGPQRRTRADAAGSMQTTLRDYARFVEATLQGRDLAAEPRAEMLRPQIAIDSKRQFPTLSTETTTANRAIRLSYGLGWGLYRTPFGEAFFKEGHDDGWRHYAVCFDEAGTGMLVMTNSSNGESLFSDLLVTLIGATSTPVEWEGFTSYR